MYGYAVIQSFARQVASRPSQSTQGDAPRPKVESATKIKIIIENLLQLIESDEAIECYLNIMK